jgi:hypothetical protein
MMKVSHGLHTCVCERRYPSIACTNRRLCVARNTDYSQIPIPLASSEVDQVARQARDRWYHQDSTLTATASRSSLDRTHTPPRPLREIPNYPARPVRSNRSTSPDGGTVYAGSQVQLRATREATRAGEVSGRGGNTGDHGMRCSGCGERIVGTRYQCANCPSEPEGYSLVSEPGWGGDRYELMCSVRRARSGRLGSMIPDMCFSDWIDLWTDR